MFALLAILSVQLPGAPPRAFDAPALAKLPQATATADFHGKRTTCTGPRLDAALAAAGGPAGAAMQGAALTRVALAEADDGYRAAFAVADLDPMLGDQAVVVALACDGAALGAGDGPLRLLAHGDRRGARSVRRLLRVRVVDVR